MGSPGWSFGRRVGFRFAILAGALWLYPFPFGYFPWGIIPRTEWLAGQLSKPWEWVVCWFARNALGIEQLSTITTGSSDRVYDYVRLLVTAIVAGLGTIAWSVLDRRRMAYPRLATGAWVVLRYCVGATLVFYGISKILRLQFPDLTPGWLDRRVGEMPPMAFLWAFMGYSWPYMVFAGVAEVIGGVLLLWRRTATIGALIVVPVMLNVVMLDLCYDVPAKLYALQLLIMSIAIVLPSARRMIAAAMGRATAAVPVRPRMSPRGERARQIAKLAILGMIVYDLSLTYRDRIDLTARMHELYGTWLVDSFVADGVEHPPLVTDPDRWMSISANLTRLWLTSMPGGHEGGGLEVDAKHRTIVLAPDDAVRTDQIETWNYTLTAADRLVIDGVHRGKHLHVTLHLEPPPPLVTRGFHWVNERPHMM